MESEDILWVTKLLAAILIGGLIIGAIFLVWINVLGPAFNQASYNNYNSSPQHVQAVAQKFSDDCLQLAQATDVTTKRAIEQDIYNVAATVDLRIVQMPDNTRTCVNSAIYDIKP
jgi:hypothetical protein